MENTFHMFEAPKEVHRQLELIQIVDLKQNLAKKLFRDADLAGYFFWKAGKCHD